MYNKTKNKENVTPIWFMRQAGRYLPEYKLIRQRKKSFFDLCFSPQLASEISLQPIKRFNFDFIILFSDILVIPYCLGQKVEFKENVGPLLNPITSLKDLEIRKTSDHISKLSPIFDGKQISANTDRRCITRPHTRNQYDLAHILYENFCDDEICCRSFGFD